MSKTEFDDLKELIDNLIVNSSINTIKIQVLTSMILGVYNQTLPADHSAFLRDKFLENLESSLVSGLPELSGGLFDEDGSFLDRKISEIPALIGQMRASLS